MVRLKGEKGEEMLALVHAAAAYIVFIGFVILVNSVRKDAKEHRRVLKYMERRK